MRKLITRCSILCSLLTATALTPVFAGEVADAINALANGEHRSAEYRARNEFRHPGETLEFFGIQPNMNVVEISPGGGGWYTEILAPYLKDNGKYYAGGNDPDSDSKYQVKNAKKYKKKLSKDPQLYSKVIVTVFSPPEKLAAAPVGSADMVVTFRNTHNWMGTDNNDKAAMQAMYSYLKPGGVLGLVQHRGDAEKAQDPKAESGYIREDLVIKLAESVGFSLEAKSEINANPKDTKDHPKGVWSLPPALSDGDKNRETYLKIGESDRMTLRFRKPND